MICAIHQPNFFPWLGFFDKIARTDVFVFLNQVDYEKSGHSMQSYTNRVAVLDSNGNKANIHCPVTREHGPQPIDKVRIKTDLKWKSDLMNRLKSYYFSSDHYDEVIALLDGLVSCETEYLSEFNINSIKTLCDRMNLHTKFVRQDELNTVHHSTELLAEIACAVGCDQYLYGAGGGKYQEDELFQKYNIEAVAQNFVPWVYKQGSHADFVGGLSIIDSFFWNGIEETGKKLIMGGD